MRLYDFYDSGNGYKIRLLLAGLGQPYEYVEIDILKGESRTPQFLARNPTGRVPVLELDDGRHLAESNAILWYLARGSRFIPDDPYRQAQVLQWLFFEQYQLEPNIAVARYWMRHGLAEAKRDRLPEKHAGGAAALAVLEQRLRDHDWLVGETYGIADIALYGYTHAAADGGFDLASWPAVTAWIDRVAARPGHVRMDDVPPAN
ncbi:glutathione S-transferase family protein [Oceanibacterium hippocampi]|uniref:Disulfide-bond oxidoreductase YfcG n=1 Tax=Oceanibacterium hippocampi TaxID=745714 RepID=A0A1Y5TVN4_9PROT|nr:glutathione S-transferase family protein [Oceanibacterium hippocampi]SLN74356.1 Disulfide-bond oxidoreductase YfcG [Oceanibacterium hippocampi]